MGDLISRKALMEELVKAEEECEEVMCVPSWATALRVIRSQPTAYDVDEVVEKLEKERGIAFVTLANTGDKECDFAYQNVVAYMDKAIEIVKGGWK